MNSYLKHEDRQESFRVAGLEPRRVEGQGPGADDELWAELSSMTSVRYKSRFCFVRPQLIVEDQQARPLNGVGCEVGQGRGEE